MSRLTGDLLSVAGGLFFGMIIMVLIALLVGCSGQLQNVGGSYMGKDGRIHQGTYVVTPARTNTSSKDDPCPELTAIGFKAWVGGADGYLADSPFPLPKKCPECGSADITYVRIQSDFPCGGWTCANNHWGGLHPAK